MDPELRLLQRDAEREALTSAPCGDYVSPRGTELCVICKRDTGIPVETPISRRVAYVEGVGQVCFKCCR